MHYQWIIFEAFRLYIFGSSPNRAQQTKDPVGEGITEAQARQAASSGQAQSYFWKSAPHFF